jgi:uncharacterized protein YdhG (YjbR/CyaY superfamily)
MNLGSDIEVFNQKLDQPERDIALEICALIAQKMPEAEGKVWHGHPVWFMEGNPIVGYSLKKSGIEMLFWSGQSFKSDALRALGKFKAAALSIPNKEALDPKLITALLEEAKAIQWDYENLPKKRELEKLGDF